MQNLPYDASDPITKALWYFYDRLMSANGQPVHGKTLGEYTNQAGIKLRPVLEALRNDKAKYVEVLDRMCFFYSIRTVQFKQANVYDFPPRIRQLLGKPLIMLRTVTATDKKMAASQRVAFAICDDGLILTSNEPKSPRVNQWNGIGTED